MKGFESINPIVLFGYFALSAAICMFSLNPIFAATALVGALINFIFLSKKAKLTTELGFFMLFLIMALINPLFVRNGMTAVLFINGNPITLEAIFYGIFSSAAIVALIYMFRLFSALMTEDKLLYVFGSAFPRLSLVLSGALRYTALLSERRKKVENARKALGAYGDRDLFGKTRTSLGVFSSLATWSLENSIITADSMSARGYGVGKRSFFKTFRFGAEDAVFAAISAIFGALVIIGSLLPITNFQYYPTLKMTQMNAFSVMVYTSYALLIFMPTLWKISEEMKWKYLKSRI